ncbi:hypothetical protein [Aneurinibacillus aneurinilyticus]|jgi:hypothetical protein|uniref:hypothetical protein n=1 Tax=Aneurinibacillus aneurinilyticus TaxID=1391 RepID=UPI0023F91850|nr:hypothetical protein [Aneurinibacillus aneurinilyticus]MCI1696856.1 hypothetical protein [Aneurinibacillus aneurinilyticus]
MSIRFDEYKLLELFGNEPKVIDEEAEIYVYSTGYVDEFLFELYFSTYDERVSVRLEYKNLSNPIFEVGLDNISRIICDEEKIEFCRDIENPVLRIYIRPSVTLDIDL